MSERWIVICGWERFQHYSDRDPPWIKNYTRLMSDENYMSLTPHRCAMLHRLWLEYARSGRELRENTLSLSRRLGMKVTRRDLEALNDAGFLEFSLANRLQDASPRARPTEAEAETEKSTYERTNDESEFSTGAPSEGLKPYESDVDVQKIDFEELLRSIVGGENAGP